MKGTKLNKNVLLAGLVVSSLLMSSCNRGYGCPTDFSMTDAIAVAVKAALAFIF